MTTNETLAINVPPAVAVFCGASPGRASFRRSAMELGGSIANRGSRLIYGGAATGLMGAVADACLDAGGAVVGVIPRQLQRYEVAHARLTQLELVVSMHERKARMADLAQAFVALPGGFGTMDETFEVLTWLQLGIHTKPICFLNVEGYFDEIEGWVGRAASEGFVKSVFSDSLRFCESIEEVWHHFATFIPPAHIFSASGLEQGTAER